MPSLRSQALLTRATRKQVKTAPAAKPKGYEGKPKSKARGKKTKCDIEDGTSLVTAPILNTVINGTAVPTEESLTKPASASHVEISEPTDDADTSSLTGGSHHLCQLLMLKLWHQLTTHPQKLCQLLLMLKLWNQLTTHPQKLCQLLMIKLQR